MLLTIRPLKKGKATAPARLEGRGMFSLLARFRVNPPHHQSHNTAIINKDTPQRDPGPVNRKRGKSSDFPGQKNREPDKRIQTQEEISVY
jgi:hypothetical protein